MFRIKSRATLLVNKQNATTFLLSILTQILLQTKSLVSLSLNTMYYQTTFTFIMNIWAVALFCTVFALHLEYRSEVGVTVTTSHRSICIVKRLTVNTANQTNRLQSWLASLYVHWHQNLSDSTTALPKKCLSTLVSTALNVHKITATNTFYSVVHLPRLKVKSTWITLI